MDLFISYSSKDKNVADAVCHVMEENSITCWVSPRDVQPGISYAKQIIQAIKDCKVFVLIFSKESNISEHVGNEVDCAFRSKKPIIPFVIENTDINEELDYYLSRKHWLVAYPDYQSKTKDLVLSTKRLLGVESNDEEITYSTIHETSSQNKTLEISCYSRPLAYKINGIVYGKRSIHII